MSPVTIAETTAGHISAPFPFPFLSGGYNQLFFGGGGGGGGGGLKINKKTCNAALDNSNGVYFLTYLLNEGWTFLLNESVKEKKKKKNGGIFGLRVWQNKALLVT